MYVVESGKIQQLIKKTVPYLGVSGPVSAKILLAAVDTPTHFLTGYGTGCSSIAHFAGQVTVVAQVNVHVNGQGCAVTLMVGTVLKMQASRTLLYAVVKSRSGEDHTFLIATQSTTIAVVVLFKITTIAQGQLLIAQYVCSELSHWFTVEPVLD